MAANDCQVLLSWRDEYATLREELLGTIKTRNEILAFTLAAAGVLIGAAAKLDGGTGLFPWAAYAVMTPAVIGFAYVLWCAEYLRMARASKQLARVENQVNTCLGRDALTWEGDRRKENAESRPKKVWSQRVAGNALVRHLLGGKFGRSSIDLHAPVTFAAFAACVAFPLGSLFVPKPKGLGLFLYAVSGAIFLVVCVTEDHFHRGVDEFAPGERELAAVSDRSADDMNSVRRRRPVVSGNCANCPAPMRPPRTSEQHAPVSPGWPAPNIGALSHWWPLMRRIDRLA